MTDALLTAEQREIRTLAREFAAGEIRPRSAGWDAARALDDDVLESLAELGFLGMRVPEALGGLGFDTRTFLVALEALSWGDAAVALSVAIHAGPVTEILLRRGSEEQKSAFLPEMAAGETLTAFALSEEGAGSDARALRTRAERDGDGWILTGTKKWVTNGDRAQRVLVFARTDEGTDEGTGGGADGGADGRTHAGSGDRPDGGTDGDGNGGGIGAFLVDRDADGYRVGRRETTLGLRASETVEVHLDGVRVGDDRLIGGASDGFEAALEGLDLGRLGIAAQALGIAQAALEHARDYALEREQFGRPIARFEAIQFKLADVATRIHAARALAHRAADRRDAAASDGDGPSIRAEAAMAKLTASETAMHAADEAVQIFGGYGYMRDYPVEKLMRDAKGTEIYEGTNQIMRLLTARDVLAGG